MHLFHLNDSLTQSCLLNQSEFADDLRFLIVGTTGTFIALVKKNSFCSLINFKYIIISCGLTLTGGTFEDIGRRNFNEWNLEEKKIATNVLRMRHLRINF